MNRLFIPLVAALAVAAGSFTCSTEPAESTLKDALTTKPEAPVFKEYRAVSPTEVDFHFSKPVKVAAISFEPPQTVAETVVEQEVVRVLFAEPLPEGREITVDLLVEDDEANTLNVVTPFRTKNAHVPAMLINELRTVYSKPKSEFVEFVAKEAGNLGALRLYIAGVNSKELPTEPVYEFPAVQVKAGEYIVLHLRSLEDEIDLIRDEVDSDLALSEGTDSSPEARDLWVPGSAKLLHTTDAVWLTDQDDAVIDAVLLSETSGAEWSKAVYAEAAGLLGGVGAWLPPSGEAPEGYVPAPADAVPTDTVKTAVTRSVSRDEAAVDSNTLKDWYVTATGKSGATPGGPNSPRPSAAPSVKRRR